LVEFFHWLFVEKNNFKEIKDIKGKEFFYLKKIILIIFIKGCLKRWKLKIKQLLDSIHMKRKSLIKYNEFIN